MAQFDWSILVDKADLEVALVVLEIPLPQLPASNADVSTIQ